MIVDVRLFATLRIGRYREKQLEFPEGITAAGIIDALAIKREDIAILLVNGRRGLPGAVICEGDTLSLFPPVGGG